MYQGTDYIGTKFLLADWRLEVLNVNIADECDYLSKDGFKFSFFSFLALKKNGTEELNKFSFAYGFVTITNVNCKRKQTSTKHISN